MRDDITPNWSDDITPDWLAAITPNWSDDITPDWLAAIKEDDDRKSIENVYRRLFECTWPPPPVYKMTQRQFADIRKSHRSHHGYRITYNERSNQWMIDDGIVVFTDEQEAPHDDNATSGRDGPQHRDDRMRYRGGYSSPGERSSRPRTPGRW